MMQVMDRQHFNGTVKEYYEMLNNDSRFHMNTGVSDVKVKHILSILCTVCGGLV
jgi:hypothetical protein